MRNDNLKLRPVDRETKSAFAKVCKEAGLSPRDALILFTESVVEQGDIPFHLKAKQLESCMYRDSSSRMGISVSQPEPEPGKLFMADTENRFFNELMGI